MNKITLSKKVLIAVTGLLLLIVGLIVAIILTNRPQEIRQRAERATKLSLMPDQATVAAGNDLSLDVQVDPGVNQVNFIQFEIDYDWAIFKVDVQSFKLNSASGLSLLKDPEVPTGPPGIITVTLSIEGNPSNVISSAKTIGTIILRARDDAKGESTVRFNETNTLVRSIGGNDPSTQNVLSSTSGSHITIGAGICRPNVATCTWGASEGATSYHYVVTNVGEGRVVKEGDVESSVTGVEFPSELGKTYKCIVTANNVCGTGAPGEASATCEITPTLSAGGNQ